jgi:hypothetical protein
MSFYSGTQAEVLYSLPAPITNTAFTTQRVVSAPTATAPVATIPAGFFGSVPNGVGRALLIRGFGTLANQATAATLAPVLALDAAAGTLLAAGTIFTLPAITPTASTVVPFNFEIYVTANVVGATGGTTLQCNGEWRHSVAATSTIPVATNLNTHVSTSLTTLSAGAQLFPELWCTCSASGTTAIVLQQFLVLGLN